MDQGGARWIGILGLAEGASFGVSYPYFCLAPGMTKAPNEGACWVVVVGAEWSIAAVEALKQFERTLEWIALRMPGIPRDAMHPGLRERTGMREGPGRHPIRKIPGNSEFFCLFLIRAIVGEAC